MVLLDKAFKVWNTVRYMTPRQWRYRLYYTGRNRLLKRVPKRAEQPLSPRLLPLSDLTEPGNRDLSTADAILDNRIPTVSGITVPFQGDWDLKGETYRLVCFRLNSFRWLLELSDAWQMTGDKRYLSKGLELIRSWQERCASAIQGDKWNAYVIAERIVNWIWFCSRYDAEGIEQYAAWIYPQAWELKQSMEYQLGANHLLSEAKALMFAGAFLQDDELYRYGKKVLLEEAGTQFLPDGGHYERSVSYHVEALQQYFEAYALMSLCEDSDAERFAALMAEPFRYLNGMIGVSGQIPLFNDSAYDYPFFDAADFLAAAESVYGQMPPRGRKGPYYRRWGWAKRSGKSIDWSTRTRYENTGYLHYRFRAGSKTYSFFMDAADCGPDENPGHAHADALSVLLQCEEKEILADTGVFTYQPGEERAACRCTRAHNTVEVDGRDSAEIWGAFRVARRGHTKVISFEESPGAMHISASHDGYRKCLKDPVEHTREVFIHAGEIEITDRLSAKKKHTAIARFHLGPQCRAVVLDNQTCVIDESITLQTDARLKLVDCDVAGLFGRKQQSTCIEVLFGENRTVKTIFKMTEKRKQHG